MGVYSDTLVQEAYKLRKQNLSYREIGKALKIPDTTIRRWCFRIEAGKGHSLREIKRNERLRKQITIKEKEFIKNKLKIISKDEARLLASILYWCEGGKYPIVSRVDFVNSDRQMMKTFVSLLRRGFDIDEKKFRVHLQIHKTHNFGKLRGYWSRLLGISLGQFLKPTVTKPTGGRHRKNYKGTCTLRYHDYRILLKLTALYEGLALAVFKV